jgi:2-amino-4-hydroxy-6-hydroxymethyldihydropteridine diphosphokinase
MSENQVKIAYLGIGSNLGDRRANIEKTKFEMQSYKINIIKSSNNFETESWPDKNKPKFINIVVKVKTSLSAYKLLKICNLIEKNMGRIRSIKNEPRTCDIDILDYDKKILNSKGVDLILPHPFLVKRNFVLLPLFEIDKTWKHPKSRLNIAKLINALPIKDLRSIKQI